jgi:hypothetical protein
MDWILKGRLEQRQNLPVHVIQSGREEEKPADSPTISPDATAAGGAGRPDVARDIGKRGLGRRFHDRPSYPSWPRISLPLPF